MYEKSKLQSEIALDNAFEKAVDKYTALMKQIKNLEENDRKYCWDEEKEIINCVYKRDVLKFCDENSVQGEKCDSNVKQNPQK